MQIHILTLFPQIFQVPFSIGIFKRAIDNNLVKVNIHNIRDYTHDKHHTVDDYAYGGGAGMVLKPEPLAAAVKEARKRGAAAGVGNSRVIYLTPSGRLFTQNFAEELKQEEQLILICGRYEGIDQRIIDLYVDDEISVGDYILSGGETAAMVVVDAVARLIEGVINTNSLEEESFRGGILEYPQYTRPKEFEGQTVPDILISGHHAKIERWRLRKSVEKTMINRPELLQRDDLSLEIQQIIEDIKGEKHGHNKNN